MNPAVLFLWTMTMFAPITSAKVVGEGQLHFDLSPRSSHGWLLATTDDGARLWDKDGHLVAHCGFDMNNLTVHDCRLEPGHTDTELVQLWLDTEMYWRHQP